MIGAYSRKKPDRAGAGAMDSSAEVAELRVLLEQAQRQIRTLARETGHLAQVEHAVSDKYKHDGVDPKRFGNTEALKHGLTSYYVEKPFRELEQELKEEGGELKLPESIYTVAICAGFFCDGNVWDQIESKLHLPGKKADAEAATPAGSTGEKWGAGRVLLGFAKNIWFMVVNALLLLIFHYFLTFCVLYFLLAHPYDTDPVPYNGTGFADAWATHFAQGECPSSMLHFLHTELRSHIWS